MHRTATICAIATMGCGTDAHTPPVTLHGNADVVVEHLGPVPDPPIVMADGAPVDVLWVATPQGVVEWSDDGFVAVAPGEATLSAEHQGQPIAWKITVDPEVMIRFVDPPVRLTAGDSTPLLLHGEIDGAPIQPMGLSWLSSDEGVATVTIGHVTAHEPGVAFITAATRHAQAVLELEVVR